MSETQRAPVIVVGTTLNPASDAVVRAAGSVARAVGGRLRAVHVLHPAELPENLRQAAPSVALPSVGEQQAGAGERLAEQLRRCGVEADDTTVAAGPAHRELGDLAEETGADLLVVGATEVPGVAQGLLGSTAARVVRRGVAPVLVVRGEPSVPPPRALVTTDLSPPSLAAVRRGLGWLDRLGAAAVELLFVVSPFQAAVGEREVDYDTAVAAARQELERLCRELEGGGARRLKPVVRRGFPVQRILERVAESGADLVVLGSHGRSGYERFLIGSIAEAVLRQAPVSVLVLPARDAGD